MESAFAMIRIARRKIWEKTVTLRRCKVELHSSTACTINDLKWSFNTRCLLYQV